MNIISIQSAISNFAQGMADAMSTDPEIKATRLAGIAKVNAEKAAAAAKAIEDKQARKQLKKIHKEERKALHVKQKSEYELLCTVHALSAQHNKEQIVKCKEEMRENLRAIRKEQASRATKAAAHVESAPSMEETFNSPDMEDWATA